VIRTDADIADCRHDSSEAYQYFEYERRYNTRESPSVAYLIYRRTGQFSPSTGRLPGRFLKWGYCKSKVRFLACCGGCRAVSSCRSFGYIFVPYLRENNIPSVDCCLFVASSATPVWLLLGRESRSPLRQVSYED